MTNHDKALALIAEISEALVNKDVAAEDQKDAVIYKLAHLLMLERELNMNERYEIRRRL